MPSDTYSPLINLLLMADGNDENTWGDNTNNNLQLIEQAIAKMTSITLAQFTGNSYTLTVLDGSSDDSRAIAIQLTSGGLDADVTVIFPVVARLYVIDNQFTNNYSPSNPDGFTVTCKTATGTATAVAQSGQSLLYVDGNGNCELVGLPIGVLATLNAYQQRTAGDAVLPVQLTFGSNVVLDPSVSDNFYITLTGTLVNLTFDAEILGTQLDGQTINLLVLQDGTGDRTITNWPTNVVWPNGTTPVLTATANGADLFTFKYIDSNWYGSYEQGYNPGGSSAQNTLTITSDCVDWSIAGKFPGLSGTPTINVVVAAGVCIGASSNLNAALTLYDPTLPSGTTINLTNYGYILGRGGDGGDAQAYTGVNGVFDTFVGPNDMDGEHGGTAIIGPGAGYTLKIANNGVIGGGGGGGGAGGYESTSGGFAAGGGGGGGAGSQGAHGGSGFVVGTAGAGRIASTPGGNSSSGRNSAAGAAGSGADSGTATGGDGGAGGSFGAAGADGATVTGGTFTISPGTGGAAGWWLNNDNVSYTLTGSGTVYGSAYTGSGVQDWANW